MTAKLPGDPLSSFVGSVGAGLGKGLGDAIGGGGGGPLISGGGWDFRSAFDGSGWTVSTGKATATGGARTGGPDMTGQPQGSIGQALGLPQQAGLGYVGMLLMGGLFVYFVARGGKL